MSADDTGAPLTVLVLPAALPSTGRYPVPRSEPLDRPDPALAGAWERVVAALRMGDRLRVTVWKGDGFQLSFESQSDLSLTLEFKLPGARLRMAKPGSR